MSMRKAWATVACFLLVGCFVCAGWTPAVAAQGNRDQARELRVKELLLQGINAYRNNDVETAVARWREVLLVDPTNERATVYLKEIEPEYSKIEAVKKERQQKLRSEAEAARKMDEKVSIEVKEGTKLRDFLNTLSFVTGINFVIVRGSDLTVVAKFEDKPFKDILDTVLLPNGLTWTRWGDVVTVIPNLETRIFRLSADTMVKMQRLYESNQLQRILWNADKPPIQGIELSLDERQSTLLVTDSPENIQKVAQLLVTTEKQAPPVLATRIYSLRPDIADKVKVLIDAALQADTEAAYALERRVLLAKTDSSADLIIKETEDNLRKVESLLKDRDFLRRIEEEKIEVYTVNLTPRDILKTNPEQVGEFGRNVKEVVETMLYHTEGVQAAQAQGRRLWYDPATLQMTLTDYPSNIRKVSDFVEALPQLEPKPRSKILYLEYAVASELASQLEDVLGISAPRAGAGAAGNEAAFSLRVEDERTFRDLSLRLVGVDTTGGIGGVGGYGGMGGMYGGMGGYGGGYGNTRSTEGTARFVARTPTSQSSDLTIQQYRSEIFEDYEIYVEKVYPSPTPGQGRVRVKVSYRPQMGTGGSYY